MIGVYHILSDKPSGNLRTSADPDVFPFPLSQFFYELANIHVHEANLFCVVRFVVMGQYIGGCSGIGPLVT